MFKFPKWLNQLRRSNIMIDFIKCEIETTPEYLLSNTLLNFGARINEQTGEVIQNRHGYIKRVAQFGSMQISITTNAHTKYNKIELSGSIHKNAQNGTNSDDFNFHNICISITEICKITRLQPHNFVLRHIEYGVNIKPTHTAQNILNSIIAYKGKGYEIREFNGTGYMKRFCFTQFDVKIYDKSKQYLLPFNVLRYEIKVFKMQYFENRGINLKTLTDLLNFDTYTQLNTTLIDSIHNLYFFDYRINTKTINNRQHRSILTECLVTDFWVNYRKVHTPKGYKKKLQRFNYLVSLYAPDCLKTYILNSVLNKWNELKNSTPNLPHVENSIVPQIYPLIVGKNRELSKKYCITCGRDISNQKKGSKYCSEKLYGHEVKKCRNKVSNRKQFELRYYTGYVLEFT